MQSKVQLVRGLYGCGLSKQQILDFFHLVDWVLALSPELEYDFQVQLAQIEEETNMPYITSIERLALQRGREEGREAGREEGREAGREEGLLLALARILSIRFSVDASPLLERLRQRRDAAEVERVIELAATAKDYAALERQVGRLAKSDHRRSDASAQSQRREPPER